MNEQSKVVVASIAGAAIGALAGYLYLTSGGRRLRDQLEPRMDEFTHEIRRLRATITKAQAVASEGWRSLNELIGERGERASQGSQWSGQRSQSSPF
jgi:hypothetical protein